MQKLVIHAERQTAELWESGQLTQTYRISTARNGAGCAPGSYCTPTGKLRVSEKIGEGLPMGAILKSRQFTGNVWDGSSPCDEDLILTRILWLEGLDDGNKNTKDRYIYLHGTNQEDLLGTPASHGCIRFSNADIVDLFNRLDTGSEVEVIYPESSAAPAQKPRA